jgi:AcrR family transcriptional regulator
MIPYSWVAPIAALPTKPKEFYRVSLPASQLKSEVVAFKRRRILEVSAHLFFEQGYERTTLDDIARQLQVTKPYIYSYFQNKVDILFEICQTGIRKSLEVLDAALSLKASPMVRLKSAIEKVAHTVIEKRKYVVVYMREEKNLPQDDAQKILEQRRVFDHRITELLDEGILAGEFSMPDKLVTATTIGGIVSWLPNWYIATGHLTESEVIASTVKLVEKMLRPE